MAKSLRQLTASYEKMVRTQRQNRDFIESGEWGDDDVFAEAYRQAAAYKGRVIETPAFSSFSSSPDDDELVAGYLIAKGTPLLDLDTSVRSFICEDVDEGRPEATRAELDDNPEALPVREYDVYCKRSNGRISHLIIDLAWRAHNKEDYSERQAREYIAGAPGMVEIADRLVGEYPSLRPSVEANVAFLKGKFGIA